MRNSLATCVIRSEMGCYEESDVSSTLPVLHFIGGGFYDG